MAEDVKNTETETFVLGPILSFEKVKTEPHEVSQDAVVQVAGVATQATVQG